MQFLASDSTFEKVQMEKHSNVPSKHFVTVKPARDSPTLHIFAERASSRLPLTWRVALPLCCHATSVTSGTPIESVLYGARSTSAALKSKGEMRCVPRQNQMLQPFI